MRKEVICYVTTNEEGEEVAVQRVTEDPTFVLVRVGQIRLVLNKNELVHAIETCDMYGKAFDEEARMQKQRAALDASRARAAAQGFVVKEEPVKKPRKKVGSKEEEGTIVMDIDASRAATSSEKYADKLLKEIVDKAKELE